MVNYVPERGDIVWLNFDPQKGYEIQKTRPAVVISPKNYNIKTNLALFIPITSRVKGYPFEIPLVLDGVTAAMLCDQVRSLDWKARNATKITTLNKTILNAALAKLLLLIKQDE